MGIFASKQENPKNFTFVSRVSPCAFHMKGEESGVTRDICMADNECSWSMKGSHESGGKCVTRKERDRYIPCSEIIDEFRCKQTSDQCEWGKTMKACFSRE